MKTSVPTTSRNGATEGTSTGSFTVTVKKIPPASITLSASAGSEGSATLLSGSFADSGSSSDAHTVSITWGDGGTLTLQARADDGWVVLDVIDTGCGMDPEVAARAFRPFVTTKPGGHGLGLATARKIVLAHGGEIAVQSEPGRGTKFTVRLPAAA